MIKRLPLVVLINVLLFSNSQLSAQPLSQVIKGIVLDKASEQPLQGASVTLLGATSTKGAITNKEGWFLLPDVTLGRQQLAVEFTGYKPVVIPEILVTAGKEVILEVPLEQNVTSLQEVTIKAAKARKGNPSNEYATSSARSFNVEEVTRFAGGRNDPSKLVSNYAGVISNNDSRNDIVVRGNAPTGVLWRIEGIASPNPNHYGTLGTTGGPITALNTNALKTSDFFSGAFPAEYGNATAAVFDIALRSGNTSKHERTFQVNLFSGAEVMLEGPISKRKNDASYLVGYRYSFVQLGQSIGLEVGTNAVPKYQDWVYHVDFGKTKLGRFSLFGMGGISRIDFIGADTDTTDFYARTDQDSYVRTNLHFYGTKHTLDIGKNTYVRTTIAYSANTDDFDQYQYERPVPPYKAPWLILHSRNQTNVLRFSSYINRKESPKLAWRAGASGELYKLKSLVMDREGKRESDAFSTLRDYNNNFSLFQSFGQFRYKPIDKLSITAGVHSQYFTFNNTYAIEPRTAISWQFNPNNTIYISYGLHSQLQPLPVYLFQQPGADGKPDQSNRDLDFTRAHHIVGGYERRFLKDWRVKTELYYQQLYDVPIEKQPSGFSMLNAGNNFTFPEKSGLINNGEGYNMGIELTAEKFLSKGFYVLSTISIFDSKYKGSDKIERNTTYNYGQVANLLTGKEWKVGQQKNNAFTLDIRFSYIGGRYVTPVDLTASSLAGKEVLDESRYNEEQLDNYYRLDTKIGFRKNSKKRKLSQTFYLDFQNVTNKENVFLRRYNPERERVGQVNQLGFFPDILYRIQF